MHHVFLLIIIQSYLLSNSRHVYKEKCVLVSGMSFKKTAQAMSLSEVEEGRGLQAPAPGAIASGPVSLSSSLPFTPINLIFRVCPILIN